MINIDIFGVDSKLGLEYCDGNTNLYHKILHSYVLDINEAIDNIKNVSLETLAAYSVYVHGIKSISQAIGAEEASETAKHLEKLAKSGNLNAVLEKNNIFVKYIEKIVNSINIWLEKNELPARQ